MVVTTAGIRGACASASLKRDDRQNALAQAPRHPRRVRLGLIEAAVLAHHALQSLRWHPRRVRLGLIEASTFASSMVVRPNGIRGACASASLKPHRPQCALTTLGRHPRRVRLGLIEALNIRWAVIVLYPGIRGACASASLKQKSFGDLATPELWSIRGACASASLKLRVSNLCTPRQPRHPRRVRLGLIEAWL